MQQCWNDDPNLRPSFSQIKTYLEGHLSVDPSKPSQQQPARQQQNSQPAATAAHESVPMRDVIPGEHLRRNDYLSLRESIPVDGYLPPSSPDTPEGPNVKN